MRYLFLVLLLGFVKISAQSEVSGTVVLEDHPGEFKASVLLKNEKGAIETYSFTNKAGGFKISTSNIGQFKLEIKVFNYNPKSIDITLNSTNQKIELGLVEVDKLKEAEIKEVVITRTTPIKTKKDTIEFNVQSFESGSELNLEELLKKLPGITVENDGKIKYGNTEIQRVMIENDDLFERGYQTLTQNMPTSPISKVQVLKNYSKNKLLKGIEDSQDVALNLTLKEGAKSKWFGNAILASTSFEEKMHQVKFNAMNFSKKRKIYALFNYNNLGLDEMKGVEYLIEPSSEKEVENVGELSTLSILNLHSKNAQFEDKRSNFNDDKLASLNYIYNFDRDWKLKVVTVFNQTENKNYLEGSYKFDDGKVQFTNSESKSWKQNRQNVVGKLELLKESKNSSLLIYNKISQLNEDNHNEFLFNHLSNFQKGENRLFANENRVVYTKKIDSSQAFVAVAKYNLQRRPYQFIDENDVFTQITGNSKVVKSRQDIHSSMHFGGLKFSYLKSWSEDQSFEWQLGDEWKREDLSSGISLFDRENERIAFEDARFKNSTELTRNKLFAQFKYANQFRKWRYGVTLLNQYISSQHNFENKQQQGFYLSPILKLAYSDQKLGNFTLSSSRSFASTNILESFTHAIYQGNRSFQESQIGLKQLPELNLTFLYNVGDILSEYLTFSAMYFKNEDYIAAHRIVNPHYTFNQSILVKDNSNLFLNLNLHKYLRFLNSRLSLHHSYGASAYASKVNDSDLINTKFSNFKTGFELKSGASQKISYELGYEWIFNSIDSDVKKGKYTDQKGFVNLYYSVGQNLQLESFYEFFNYGHTQNSSTQFLDFRAAYHLKKWKLNLFLRGNNLLNTDEIQRYSLTNISESLYTQKLLPRHIVLGLNKTF